MRTALAFAGLSVLMLLFTWLTLQSYNSERQATQQALYTLDQFAATESALQRDVLRARAGMLRNYDPLVKEIKQLRQTAGDLATFGGEADERLAVGRLNDLVDQQERLVEQFKSQNSLLQNSLAYFGLFASRLSVASQDPLIARSVSGLATAMLHLTLDPTSAIAEVEQQIRSLSAVADSDASAGDVRAVMAHALLLQKLLPATDVVLHTLYAVPHVQAGRDLRGLVLARQDRAEAIAQRSRLLLTGVSLILIVLIVYLARGLQLHAASLRSRADLEHVIARNSTKLINSRANETAAYVERALAELTECIGADRGYLVIRSGTEKVHSWCRPGVTLPEGWPERAMAFAARLQPDPPHVVYATRGTPPDCLDLQQALFVEFGLTGWICVPGTKEQRVDGILAFDALRENSLPPAGDVGSLRMAFNAMANALQRDEIEQERSRLEKSLQHARRIETVGAFASGIAHNFNNIIGAILGYAEMGLARVKPDSALARNIEEIRRAAERAHDLVDQILKFGRRGELKRSTVPVDALLDETESLLRATLPPAVTLTVSRALDTAMVAGEAVQLQQVIFNLCTNSVQAVRENGSISIEASERDLLETTRFTHGELEPGRYLVLAVADTGRGMSRQTLERAFDPFFTTRLAGNGLGLATVREIVLDHGGGLSVESELGRGTRIEVWLPAERMPTEVQQPIPQRGHGETVLIIDCEDGQRVQTEEVIAALGYEPVGFASLDDAVRGCETGPCRFDVVLACHTSAAVLLDAATALRRVAPALPVLVAAPRSDAFQSGALMRAGITEVLFAPLHSADLAEALERALSRKPKQAPTGKSLAHRDPPLARPRFS